MIKADLLFKNDVFQNVSFETDSGVVCLLSKKPERTLSLLQTISGITVADGGSISGNNDSSYISKGCALPENLTVNEYLSFVCSIKKCDLPLESAELTEELNGEFICNLTPFERLVLSVAASLIGLPSLIAVDEPYYGISHEEYGDVKEVIRSVSKTVPVFFTSSSVFECKELSDSTLVLSGEKQIFFGNTETLFKTDIKETDICCLVKGDLEKITSSLERFSPEIEQTARPDVFAVSLKSVPIFKAAETRSRIKKQLTKSRLALLETKSDKEALLNIIGELSENDRKKRIQREETEEQKLTKITQSLISFSHEDDQDEEEEETEDGTYDED